MTGNYTILAINDISDQLELLKTILQSAGYQVLTARSGNEGFETARRNLPDLIISDVMMPDGDGIELCRRIRADQELRFMPILLLSAVCKDMKSIVRGIEIGADDYLQIPFDPMHLIAKAAGMIERKRMNDALRESENRFRSMIENLTDVISILAPDGRIIYESPSLKSVLGFEPEELIGKNAFDFIHPEDAARVIAYFRQALEHPAAADPIEYRFLHKNKSWRIVQSVGKHFKDPVNGLVAIINSRDVTDRKSSEISLRKSEERFKAQFKNLPIPTITWKRAEDDFILEDFNDAAIEITCGRISDFIGVKASEMYEQEPQVLENFKRCFSEQTTIKVESPLTLKTTGERKHLDMSFIFIAPDIVMLHYRDITCEKDAQESLRKSEERFQLASHATDDMLWDWDMQTDSLWFSDTFYNLLGYSRKDADECIGFWNEAIHPDDKERVINSLKSVIDKQGNSWTAEYSFRRFDETFAYILDRGYIIYGDDGAPSRMIGAMMDISERKQTQEQLDLFFNTSVDMICFAGFDGYFKRLNPAWEKLLGYSLKELLSKPFIEFVHPDDRESTLREAQKNYIGEKVTSFENRYLCKDGSYKWLLWNSVTVPDEQMIYAVAHDITDRKRADATLRFQKILLKAQSEASIDGILVVSPNNEIIFYNHRFAEMWGIPEELLAVKTGKELLKAVADQVVEPEEVLETVSYLYEHPFVKDQIEISLKDGRIFERYTSPVTDVDGMHFGRVWFFRDITTRKQTEEAIRFQAVLLDTVEQAVIATDLKGIVTYWNRFAQELYGWTPAEAIGHVITELTTPEISQANAAVIMEQLSKGKSWSGEFLVQNKEGKHFSANISNSPVFNSQGELIGIVGISFDLTERKETEKTIVEANKRAIRDYDKLLQKLTVLGQNTGAARDLQTIFRAILDFTQATVPCSGFFIALYNAEKQLRTPAYAWDGGHEFDVSSLPPMEMSLSPNSRAISTGEIIIEDNFQAAMTGQPVVNIGLEKDPELPQSCLVVPMAFMGRIVGAIEVQSTKQVAFAREHATAMQMAANLTANAIENVRLMEQERVREEQLRQAQKLESVGRLAGGVAHDFNNMLTAINGYSGMILRQLGSDDPLRSKVEEIKKAGERSASLTHQLLAFSRQQVLNPKVLDINEVIVDTSKMLQRLIGEDVQLSIVPGHSIGSIEVDPGQLTQVIMNLAVNARDAMTNGGSLIIETANVYLDEEYAANHVPCKTGAYVMLAVTDTGCGMSDETLQHIFEPFYTTKEVGKGTGLGLATVYGIIKQSSGYVWVYSEIDKGTTFKIYFPRVDKASETDEALNKAEKIPCGSETVLLVEDEETVRNLTRQILEACGYRVIEAQSGVEALAICQNADHKIDLLLTDVVMPKMGGRELAEKLKEINPEIRQLYMSGYTDDAIIRQGMISEEMNFIQKPFTFEGLAQKIREVMDGN